MQREFIPEEDDRKFGGDISSIIIDPTVEDQVPEFDMEAGDAR